MLRQFKRQVREAFSLKMNAIWIPIQFKQWKQRISLNSKVSVTLLWRRKNALYRCICCIQFSIHSYLLICPKPLDFEWQCLRNSLECIVAFGAFSSAFTVIPLLCHKTSYFEWQCLRNSLSCYGRSSYQNGTRSILKHRLFQN